MKIFLLICALFSSLVTFTQEDIDIEHINVTINHLRVEGLKKTRDNVVFGESKLTVGDTIQLTELYNEFEKSKRNLWNSGLFNEVDISIEKWNDQNEVDIVFNVKERWYIYPIPIVELTGITFSEWKDDFNYDLKRLSYGVSARHYNLTGRGDRADLVLKTGFQKQLGGSYIVNVDKKRNWGLGFVANYAQNKGVAYNSTNNELLSYYFEDENVIKFANAGLAVFRRKNINRRHSLGFNYNTIRVPHFVNKLNPDFINNVEQSFGSIGYSFVLEQRDLADYPTKGIYTASSIGFDGIGSKDVETFTTSAQVNYYKPIAKKQYLSASFNGRYLNDNNIPFYNLLRKGPSSGSLPRGYDAYRLLPKSYISFKSEYRIDIFKRRFNNIPLLPSQFEPINLRVLPKVFFDYGHTFSNDFVENNQLNNSRLYSYGVGVDIVTIYNTPLIIEFGKNHLSQNTLNFGLGKTF